MNPEIRFNPPVQETQTPKEEPKRRARFLSILKFLLKLLGVIIVLAVVIFLAKYVNNLINGNTDNNAYSAVFLTNGQVYFGKMTENNESEIVLNNVYYIQLSDGMTKEEAAAAINQTRFNLIKLGNELHGPTDELFINRSQVVFYEYLRDDSKVVESIRNYK